MQRLYFSWLCFFPRHRFRHRPPVQRDSSRLWVLCLLPMLLLSVMSQPLHPTN